MKLFDDLLVANFVQERLQQTVPSIKKLGNRWNFRCPICGDSKKSKKKMRGNYYPKNNSYYCFNEGCSCSGLYILARFENRPITEIKKEFIQWQRPSSRRVEELDRPAVLSKDTIDLVEYSSFDVLDTSKWTDLPSEVELIIKFRRIYDAPFKPKGWKLFYDPRTSRIIIPWMDNNQIVYFQSRATNNKQDPKYLFPSDLDKPIFGLDMVDDSFPYVFLLEGVFDSIFIKNGLAMGGKTLTDYQKKLLNGIMCKKVLFFDNQWQDKSGRTETLKIAQSDRSQLIFIWPRELRQKDLNECAMECPEFIERLKDLKYVESRLFSGARALLEFKK